MIGRRGINYLGDGVTDSRARQRSRIRFTVILTVKPGFQAYRECRKETHQQQVNRLLSVVKPCSDHCGNIMFYVDNSDVDACVII